MACVCNEVKRIVHCDADDNRSYGKYDERHVSSQHGDERHGKEPAENNGDANKQKMSAITESKYQ